MSDSEIMQYVIVFGLLCGATLRTVLPFLKKARKLEKQGIQVSFKPKYLASLVLSLIATAFIVIEGFTAFNLAYPNATAQGVSTVFMASLMFGFAFNSIANRFFDLYDEDDPSVQAQDAEAEAKEVIEKMTETK